MPRLALVIISAAFCAATAQSQGTSPAPAKEPIADNSFLIEESYNQEPGVVQHISGFTKTTGSKDWAYSFTQEWPAPGKTHQLSYTLPFTHFGDPSTSGIGDLMINYRYQAVDDEKRGLAVSPRLSISLPTGDDKKGLGLGGTGYQVDLPISKTLGESFVTHTNVGATWFPSATAGGIESLHGVNLGQSLVWLAAPRFNVMLEAIWSRTTSRSGAADATVENAFISPSIRWGYDFPSGLQVVPGVAFPIGVGQSKGIHQVLLYLSFEHPFTAAARPGGK